jgi:hypothetical protein
MTLTLDKATAQELVWDDSEEYEVIKTISNGSSRWSAHKTAIFCARGAKDTGPWYKVDYSHGLTESQDEAPFEYEDTVRATEVFPVAVQKIEWRNKPATIEGNTN